jgi:hypothetical protein
MCDVNRDSGTDRANGGWLRRPLFDRCFHFFAVNDAVTRLKNS